jgi:membrane fusion protein, macrolide-specific efflux system
MRKKWVLFLLGLVVLILAAGLLLKNNSNTENWAQLKKGTVVEAVYGIGTVTARRTFDLKLGVAATLSDLYVEEGDYVTAGSKLIKTDFTFTAPFSGIITQVLYKSGETVTPQTPILTLSDFNSCYILVNLEQQGAIKIKPGLKAVLNFESMRDQKFTGIVKHVYSHKGQFYVNITPDSLSKQILPGMTADVAIQTALKNEVVLVPVSAINEGKVRRKRGGNISVVPIQTGQLDGQMAESIGPTLQEGDWVALPAQKPR